MATAAPPTLVERVALAIEQLKDRLVPQAAHALEAQLIEAGQEDDIEALSLMYSWANQGGSDQDSRLEGYRLAISGITINYLCQLAPQISRIEKSVMDIIVRYKHDGFPAVEEVISAYQGVADALLAKQCLQRLTAEGDRPFVYYVLTPLGTAAWHNFDPFG